MKAPFVYVMVATRTPQQVHPVESSTVEDMAAPRKKWESERIKAALVRRRTRQVAIARQAGTSRSAVNGVIEGRFRSGRLRRVIADAIGVPVDRIWPDEASEDRPAAVAA